MTGAIVCIILSFICFCLAVASTRTPQAALFFKNKTRGKGLAFWLILACCFLLIGGAYMPEPGTAQAQNPQQLNYQAGPYVQQFQPTPPIQQPIQGPQALQKSFDQAGFLNEAMMAQNITAAKVAIRPLYDQLLALRQTPLFREAGLVKGDIQAYQWKLNVEKLQAAINQIQALPVEIKAAPAYLLDMAESAAWRNGQPDAKAEMAQRIINVILNLQ